MTLSDELTGLFKPSKKEGEREPKYIMIRFGVSNDGCAFSIANPDISITKLVLDSLEKIPNINIREGLSYRPIGIFYEITEQNNDIKSKVENKFTK